MSAKGETGTTLARASSCPPTLRQQSTGERSRPHHPRRGTRRPRPRGRGLRPACPPTRLQRTIERETEAAAAKALRGGVGGGRSLPRLYSGEPVWVRFRVTGLVRDCHPADAEYRRGGKIYMNRLSYFSLRSQAAPGAKQRTAQGPVKPVRTFPLRTSILHRDVSLHLPNLGKPPPPQLPPHPRRFPYRRPDPEYRRVR